jgi:hypothetical protein
MEIDIFCEGVYYVDDKTHLREGMLKTAQRTLERRESDDK